MKPTVSIIIPNYNHASFLKQRLDTVFNQTYQNFEVILLDDASTDGSEVILQSYKAHPKVSHLIINEANSGSPFKQWQKGIDLAKGDYIWIAESDDYCEFNFLEKLIAHLKPNIGVAYVQSVDIDEKGKKLYNRIDYTNEFMPNIWEKDFILGGKDFIKNYLLVKNVIPNTSAVVFKKEFVGNAIFDEELLSMAMCGDWLFWMKLCKQSSVLFYNHNLNYFRTHGQITRQHKNTETKKRRLIEEKIIRSYAYNELRIIDKKRNEELYNKWFKLHNVWEIFKSRFYSILMPFSNKAGLFLKFIIYKIKI